MATKSQYLQIRLTPRQKAKLKRMAAAAGEDVSSYVLSRALPAPRLRFEQLLTLLDDGADHGYVLAELNDFLSALAPAELAEAVAQADTARLSPFLRNYVAAMVEQASHQAHLRPPRWTALVEPLEAPWFAAPLVGLRPHLLRASPVPFKRRNLFVDAAVGDRV
jgi:hypothetical protein